MNGRDYSNSVNRSFGQIKEKNGSKFTIVFASDLNRILFFHVKLAKAAAERFIKSHVGGRRSMFLWPFWSSTYLLTWYIWVF